jgi:FHS family L-fucose permease-like MFS transporter
MEKAPTIQNQSHRSALVLLGMLFFVFGFFSWINAVLIPYFKLICSLNASQSMLVAFAFYISYFVMAIPSSWVLRRTGLKNGMTAGLVVMALGALIFIPAAMQRAYPLFLVALFVQATGLTLLQTASNPYITILGPLNRAAQRISIMGICNKLAGAVAPLTLIDVLTKSDDEVDTIHRQLPSMPLADQTLLFDELSARLILPYAVMTAFLLALGLLVRYSSLPELEEPESESTDQAAKSSIFQYPHLLLGAMTIFCGVSVEVLAVDSIIGYGQYKGMLFEEARYFATYTMLFMISSYLVGIIATPRFVPQRRMLQGTAILGLLFSMAVLMLPGHASVWAVSLLGLSNALLWPSIWPLALDGLGRFTKQGSALLIMGVVGGALTPLLYGLLSDQFNPQQAYWILLPLYAFILFYASSGYRIGKILSEKTN